MNLTYISSSMIPSKSANSIQVLNTVDALISLGINVELIGVKNYKNDISISDYGLLNHIKMNLIKRLNIPFFGGMIYAKTITRKFLNKNHIYYLRDIYTAFIFPKNKHFIIEIHEIPKNLIKRKILQKIIHSSNLKHIVVISRSLEKYITKKYPRVNHSNVSVIPDASKEIESNNKVEVKNKQIGYFGSLKKEKGISIILSLAKLLPDYDFNIFGGNEKEISKLEKKSSNNINYMGYINRHQLNDRIREQNILIAPFESLDYKKKNVLSWMSPLKIFDYMASGRPMIVSDLPVINEVLTNNKNAILCKPHDFDCWIKKIKILSYDKKISNKIAINAINLFKTEYSWESRAKKIYNIIYDNQVIYDKK